MGLILVAGFFLLIGCENSATPPLSEVLVDPPVREPSPPNTASWLVLVYMAAANNLEGEALVDLNRMELGLAEANQEDLDSIKVLALVDRISAADMGKTGSVLYDTKKDGDWTGTRLYEVLPDKDNDVIASKALESAGAWRLSRDQEEHMGNKDTLRSFISWALEAYPDYQYQALILWNHGGGVSVVRSLSPAALSPAASICLDGEDYDGEYGLNGQLFMGEIRDVLAEIYDSGKKIEVIGFDACYMGMYEVAYEFRDVANYFVASPGLEYRGWDYRTLFKKLRSFTDGAAFVREQVQSFRDVSGTADHSMTAYDLSKIQGVKTTLDDLARVIAGQIRENRFTRATLESLRDKSVRFSPSNEVLEYPFFELGSFCDALIELSNNDAIIAASQSVRAALQAGLVYAWKSTVYPGWYNDSQIPYGLSFFFSLGNRNIPGFSGDSHYSAHWFYTHLDTNTQYHPGFYYGHIDAADSNSNGTVETWQELLEYLYDKDNKYTPWTY
jgi:hypothetical protein